MLIVLVSVSDTMISSGFSSLSGSISCICWMSSTHCIMGSAKVTTSLGAIIASSGIGVASHSCISSDMIGSDRAEIVWSVSGAISDEEDISTTSSCSSPSIVELTSTATASDTVSTTATVSGTRRSIVTSSSAQMTGEKAIIMIAMRERVFCMMRGEEINHHDDSHTSLNLQKKKEKCIAFSY